MLPLLCKALAWDTGLDTGSAFSALIDKSKTLYSPEMFEANNEKVVVRWPRQLDEHLFTLYKSVGFILGTCKVVGCWACNYTHSHTHNIHHTIIC
jgi:hypothetical protein